MTKEDKRILEIALCNYLPYELKVKIIDKIRNYKEGQIRELKGQLFWDCGRTQRPILKPILRPLSDLTRLGTPIIQPFSDALNISQQLQRLDNDASILPYQLFEVLLENHFDVFGLIEKGLAIDINTIKE